MSRFIFFIDFTTPFHDHNILVGTNVTGNDVLSVRYYRTTGSISRVTGLNWF